jgi:DNA-binding transcriptional LysR family regulator
VPRRIGIHADQMRVGVELCARGEYLAVLPDVFARTSGVGPLRRLPGAEIPSVPMFAVHRPTLGPRGRAEALVEAVQRRING